VEQINQVTKLKLIEMMKVNNSRTKEKNTIILFTQFGVNEPTSGGESNSPFHYIK
jgi:hypothetical protein